MHLNSKQQFPHFSLSSERISRMQKWCTSIHLLHSLPVAVNLFNLPPVAVRNIRRTKTKKKTKTKENAKRRQNTQRRDAQQEFTKTSISRCECREFEKCSISFPRCFTFGVSASFALSFFSLCFSLAFCFNEFRATKAKVSGTENQRHNRRYCIDHRCDCLLSLSLDAAATHSVISVTAKIRCSSGSCMATDTQTKTASVTYSHLLFERYEMMMDDIVRWRRDAMGQIFVWNRLILTDWVATIWSHRKSNKLGHFNSIVLCLRMKNCVKTFIWSQMVKNLLPIRSYQSCTTYKMIELFARTENRFQNEMQMPRECNFESITRTDDFTRRFIRSPPAIVILNRKCNNCSMVSLLWLVPHFFRIHMNYVHIFRRPRSRRRSNFNNCVRCVCT